jgi:hypothetical protein
MRDSLRFSSMSLALFVAGVSLLAACSSDSSPGSDSDIPPVAGGLGLGGAAGVAGSASSGAGGLAGSAGKGGSGAGGVAGAGGAAAGAGGAVAGGAGAGGAVAGAGGDAAGAGGDAAGAGGAAAGAGGDAGGQAGAAGASDCLDPAQYADSIDVDPSLCVVRAYRSGIDSFGFSLQLSWGRQNGPLTTIGGKDKALVQRWDLPATPTGTLTAPAGTNLQVPGVPSGIFWGPAFDLPFLDFSAIPYTGSPPSFSGELLALDATFTTVKSRAFVNGFYAGVGYESGGEQRLLYTGLSGLDGAASDTSSSGVYGSSLCAGQLAPTAACTPSSKLGAWATSSGPIVRDSAGYVIISLDTSGAEQEVRVHGPGGLEASGASDAYKNTNFTTSLAAIAPSGAEAGWLFAQETDSTTFAALSLYATRYAPNPAGDGASFQKLDKDRVLAAKAPGANPIVVSGNDGLVWIATDTPANGGMFFAFKPR